MKTRSQVYRYLLILVVLLMSGSLFACAVAGNTENSGIQADSKAVRIIIGFDSPEVNPQDPGIIKTISNMLGAEMKFVRKLSGNAAVYSARSQLGEEHLITELEQLKAITYIRYAELDQRHQIQAR
ncbi:MAG: hypothetical protein JXA04_06075 [Gammaproteobacteria bacterium]|nr:hypothetical protein [Gammaproteobacteria bacterium]